jgi:hypothetical protein
LIEIEAVKVMIGDDARLARLNGLFDQVRQVAGSYAVNPAIEHIEDGNVRFNCRRESVHIPPPVGQP